MKLTAALALENAEMLVQPDTRECFYDDPFRLRTPLEHNFEITMVGLRGSAFKEVIIVIDAQSPEAYILLEHLKDYPLILRLET